MSIVANWQRLAFQKNLRILLSHIAGSALNFLEFQLLVQQANILFYSQEDEARCRRLFSREVQVLKAEVARLLFLVATRVFHTQQQFVVRFRKSKKELFHSRHACFNFWKDRMAQKYGHVHEWFQSLCQERDIRRVALSRFLSHLERVLHDTQHSECAKTVSMAFEKSRKNEIELSVFMNTILIDTRNSLRSSISRTQRTKSSLPITNKKQRYQETEPSKQQLFKEESTAAYSSNKPGYSSLRQLGPMKSLSKYLTPHRHLKKYNSFLTG